MSRQNQPEFPSKVYAEAVVRSASGASLLRCSSLVTSENVAQFQAEPNLVTLAAKRLQAAGFEILDVGKALISIAAKREVYERSFRTRLEAIERPVIKEMGQPSTATFINSVDGKPFGEIDTSETIWNEVLDGIAINEPIYYTQRPSAAIAPPTTTKKYLNLPDDVAQGLNAIRVHQNGITGKGVRVVMIDSGWYPHPFFRHHNYKVNVLLSPGATEPEQDDSGHGTGESANVFAIAPEAELTMIKFDVAREGKLTNVTSVAALKQAIEQRPDIISCSWGSDQRSPRLSPQDKVLAAVIARAVREGIVVIFAAGNGSWGFPAQHPDAIAVGGVYKHLDGSLKGLLEASNYASSFISPVYPGRQVPDLCGLVGQLPDGAYIMLPIPPDGWRDRVLSVVGDGTSPSDGWAAFSGTSAAAPQLAGICALMKQVDPSLSPARVKQILQQTARDVVEGFSNPDTGGHRAREGVDLATGYGLADAYEAVRATQDAILDIPRNSSALFQTPELIKTERRTQEMYSEYPKLKAKLDEIQERLDEVIKAEFIDQDLIEDVELKITEANFIPRSFQSKAVFSLRKLLTDLPKNSTQELEPQAIEKKHILAAESLIRMNRCQELAMVVLVTAIGSAKKEVPELAAKALGEFSTQVTSESTHYFACDGNCCSSDNGKTWYNTSNSKTYTTLNDCKKSK